MHYTLLTSGQASLSQGSRQTTYSPRQELAVSGVLLASAMTGVEPE